MTLVVPYRTHNKGWVERQAEWYYSHMTTSRWPYVLETVQTALEVISMVGLLITFKRKEKLRRLREECQFNSQDHRVAPHIKASPFDSRTYTRSHLAEIAIHQDRIWMRLAGVWKSVFYSGPRPIFVKTDGANLWMIDENHDVHYKKLFAEFRSNTLPLKKQVHFVGTAYEQYDYLVVDKSRVANWKFGFFHPPFGWPFYKLLPSIKIDPAKYRSITMSHRGVFSDHYSDNDFKKHSNGCGTTTLSLLALDGRSSEKKDPWCPPSSVITVPLHEYGSRYFEALREEASSSTYMYVGRWNDKKDLIILTVVWDVDIRGSNPFFRYSYDPKDTKARTLSSALVWKTHEMPPGTLVLPLINIMQTGKGDNARMLYVGGRNSANEWGVFQKTITANASEWQFTPDHRVMNQALSIPPPIPGTSRVREIIVPFKGHRLQIRNFGPHRDSSAAILSTKTHNYAVIVARRLSLLNYMGIDSPHWDVVAPSSLPTQYKEVRKIFGGKASCSINLQKEYEIVKADVNRESGKIEA